MRGFRFFAEEPIRTCSELVPQRRIWQRAEGDYWNGLNGTPISLVAWTKSVPRKAKVVQSEMVATHACLVVRTGTGTRAPVGDSAVCNRLMVVAAHSRALSADRRLQRELSASEAAKDFRRAQSRMPAKNVSIYSLLPMQRGGSVSPTNARGLITFALIRHSCTIGCSARKTPRVSLTVSDCAVYSGGRPVLHF